MIPYFYGAIIIGPSGVGKTTVCNALSQMMSCLDRKCVLINLDPANQVVDEKLYQINISDLITVEDVMKELNLGPNASLLYAFTFLLDNIDWLYTQLLQYKDHYLIFDFPGQIELYLNNDSITKLIHQLTSKNNQQLQVSLVAIQLFDCLNCYQSNTFISTCLLSLCSEMNIELPYISVLNKIDLIKQFGELPMSLEYYLEANDLNNLVNKNEKKDKFTEKYGKLQNCIVEMMDEKRKISFEPLHVENKKLIVRLILKMDKANGYYYLESNEQNQVYSQIQNEIGDEVDYMPTELLIELEHELFPEEFE